MFTHMVTSRSCPYPFRIAIFVLVVRMVDILAVQATDRKCESEAHNVYSREGKVADGRAEDAHDECCDARQKCAPVVTRKFGRQGSARSLKGASWSTEQRQAEKVK